MKASLDTCVIINLYRANAVQILFDAFPDGIFVYKFIRDIEMKRHGADILSLFDSDVSKGKIMLIDDEYFRSIGMYLIFAKHVNNERILYNSGDMGEVYATALARTLGAFAVVTDDIKLYGPHYTLMVMLDSNVMPFSFNEVLLLNYLDGIINADEYIDYFNLINETCKLNWDFSSKLRNIIKRFSKDPYTLREKEWMRDYCSSRDISFKTKLNELFNTYQTK